MVASKDDFVVSEHMSSLRILLLFLTCLEIGCSGKAEPKEASLNAVGPAIAPTTADTEYGPDQTRYDRQFSIIIGIDDYSIEKNSIDKLEYAVNDATDVRNILRDEYGFSTEHYQFLTNAQATRQAIEDSITKWLPAQLPTGRDSLLFFFSGHGLIDQESNEGFLVASDSRNDAARKNCVVVSYLVRLLENIPCKHKLVVLDSCYSGTLFRDFQLPQPNNTDNGGGSNEFDSRTDRSRDPILNAFRTPCFAGISAGRLTPVAEGSGKDHHSTFTSALLRELKDRADSQREDHAFTFRQLAARIEARVRDFPGSQQQPKSGYLGPGEGDLVFRATVPRATPTERAKHTSHAVELARVRRMMAADFLLAQEYVFDTAVFPPEQRDTAWSLLAAQMNGIRKPLVKHPGPVQWMQLVKNDAILLSIDVTGVLNFTALDGGTSRTVKLAADIDAEMTWCAVLSPDERRLFVGTFQGTVRVFDIDYDRLSLVTHSVLSVHGKPTSIAARGEILAVSTNEGSCHLFDLATLSVQPPIAKHEGGIFAMALSPDGTQLATGCTDGRIRIWQTAHKRQLQSEFMHVGTATSITFLRSDRPTVAALAGNTLRIWDVKSGLVVHSESNVLALTPSDSTGCTFTSSDHAVFEFDLTREKRVMELVPPCRWTPALSIMCLPAGRVYVSHIDGTVISTLPSGRNELRPSFRSSRRPEIRDTAIVDHGRSVVLCCDNHMIRHVSAETFLDVGTGLALAGEATQLCYCPRTGAIGLAFADGSLGVLHRDSQQLHALRQPFPDSLDVSGLLISDDGASLLAGSSDGDLVEWNTVTNHVRNISPTTLAAILAIALAPDRSSILVGTDQHGLSVRNDPAATITSNKTVISGSVWSLAVGQNSSLIAAFGTPNVATLFSYPSFQKLHDFSGASTPVWSACFSPDERSIVTGGDDGWLRIYDAATGIALLEFPAHNGRIDRVSISPEGTFLTSKDDGGELAVWRMLEVSPADAVPGSENNPSY